MTRRGPKPKPPELRLIGADVAKNPQRYRDANNPAAPSDRPTKPSGLDRYAAAEWKRITAQLDKLGILSSVDVSLLQLYCESWSSYKQAAALVKKHGVLVLDDKGNFKRNPADVSKAQYLAVCNKLLPEFGLSPSSRSRVQVDKSKSKAAGIVSRNRTPPA